MNEFGQGFSKRNLEYMRRFYLLYRERLSQIAQTPSAQLPVQVQGREAGKITQTPSAQFSLGWSHYVFLMAIDDGDERSFYEIEALSQNGMPDRSRKHDGRTGCVLPGGNAPLCMQ
jgi:hypothetical protein